MEQSDATWSDSKSVQIGFLQDTPSMFNRRGLVACRLSSKKFSAGTVVMLPVVIPS